MCRSFAELNNFSKGFSKPKKDAQVIRVRGAAPHEFFNLNYLLLSGRIPPCLKDDVQRVLHADQKMMMMIKTNKRHKQVNQTGSLKNE